MHDTVQRWAEDSRENVMPLLTVGICACTEIDSVEQLVDKSLQSRIGESTRIVVVTPNRTLADRLSGCDPRVSVILEGRREGKAAAMNKLLGHVSGDIVVYASGDAAMGPDAVPALVDTLRQNPRYGAVIAHVVPVNGRGMMGRISSLIWRLFNGVSQDFESMSRLAQANDLYAFRKDLIQRIPQGTINDDTYIATTIRNQGFLVSKSNLEVMISGPGTPYDYVIQRSRIVRGHLQSIRNLKVVPTVFEFSILSTPIRSLRILVSTVARLGPKYGIALFMACYLEFVTWVHAMAGAILGRDIRVWKVAQSTKGLSRHQTR
jgi:cellulose synthase/poly-beta-1,6-N-acetylglucosamine synthase-like glycosyltransferase